MLQINLKVFNAGGWDMWSVACDCVGINIPVGSDINDLCFVCSYPKVPAS